MKLIFSPLIALSLNFVGQHQSIQYADRVFSHAATYSDQRSQFERKFLNLKPVPRYRALLDNWNRLENRKRKQAWTSRDEFEWLLTVGTINSSVAWPIDFDKYPATLSILENSTDFEVLRARWLSDRRYAFNDIPSLRKFGQRLLAANPRDYWVLHALANMEGCYVGGDQAAGLAYIDRLAKLKPNDPWTEFRWAKAYEYRLFTGGRQSDLDKAIFHFKEYFKSSQDPVDLVKSQRDEYASLIAKSKDLVKLPKE